VYEFNNVPDQMKQALLDFVRDLVRIPSQNPPGDCYPACAERIRAELTRLGFPSQLVEAPGFGDRPRVNLLAFHGEGERTLYFHGHYDVVPAQRPAQFAPRLAAGWLHGRGTADMKAGLACMLYAASLLKESAMPLTGRLGLCFVADEETGGRGGSRYLDEIGLLGRDAIGMLTPEPTSGVVWNANRGALTLRVTVRGKPAHVGLQHQGINAFERMLRAAGALQALKAEVERRRTGYRIAPESAAYSILMLGGEVAGGTNFNVVPDRCSFTLERRFNPEEELAAEKARLSELFDALRAEGIELEVESLQEGNSSGTPDDHPVARTLAESVREVTGAPPAFEMCPGLLETRWYARQGVPAFAYGPGLLELSHGPDEAVEVERIFQHTLIYARTAARLLA